MQALNISLPLLRTAGNQGQKAEDIYSESFCFLWAIVLKVFQEKGRLRYLYFLCMPSSLLCKPGNNKELVYNNVYSSARNTTYSLLPTRSHLLHLCMKFKVSGSWGTYLHALLSLTLRLPFPSHSLIAMLLASLRHDIPLYLFF